MALESDDLFGINVLKLDHRRSLACILDLMHVVPGGKKAVQRDIICVIVTSQYLKFGVLQAHATYYCRRTRVRTAQGQAMISALESQMWGCILLRGRS